MAQFTPAPVDIHPKNWLERLVALAVLFVGLILLTTLIGNVTALVNQSRQAAFARLRRAELIRDFLTDNRLPTELGRRITHFLTDQPKHRHRVLEADVPGLQALPLSVRIDMRYEVYGQRLTSHPFFHWLNQQERAAVMETSDTAISEVLLAQQEEPFIAGDQATSMYLLVAGEWRYYYGLTGFNDEVADVVAPMLCDPGQFLCEGALWLKWQNQGLLRAVSKREDLLLKISGERLAEAMRKHNTSGAICGHYANLFLRHLLERLASDFRIDDTFVAYSNWSDLNEQLCAAIGIAPLPSNVPDLPCAMSSSTSFQRMWAALTPEL